MPPFDVLQVSKQYVVCFARVTSDLTSRLNCRVPWGSIFLLINFNVTQLIIKLLNYYRGCQLIIKLIDYRGFQINPKPPKPPFILLINLLFILKFNF